MTVPFLLKIRPKSEMRFQCGCHLAEAFGVLLFSGTASTIAGRTIQYQDYRDGVQFSRGFPTMSANSSQIRFPDLSSYLPTTYGKSLWS
jgi:hypothetical protein